MMCLWSFRCVCLACSERKRPYHVTKGDRWAESFEGTAYPVKSSHCVATWIRCVVLCASDGPTDVLCQVNQALPQNTVTQVMKCWCKHVDDSKIKSHLSLVVCQRRSDYLHSLCVMHVIQQYSYLACRMFVRCCVLGNLDLVGLKQVFKAENNPWVPPIADQLQIGVSHVFDYIRTDTYKL